MKRSMSEYEERFMRHYDELKWLYCELYPNRMEDFERLCTVIRKRYQHRGRGLKERDRAREEDPLWYKKNDLVGMMMYTEGFGGDLKGVKERLSYLEESRINYLHLMPLLETPDGKSDGGYAVSDFTAVKKSLGSMQDLTNLTEACHERGISVCLDFVMNHTSEEHEWAKRARSGERKYQDRYFFFDSFDIPAQYEASCPQVFPTTAPGNFTWLPDCRKYVMTTFYPYQWDLNYRNPEVFCMMLDYMLNLANRGVDIIRLDAVPYIWKEPGTNCRNLKEVHSIVRMMRMICEIVCPGMLLLGEVVMEPAKVAPYFGTVEKPECHMLYNVTTMATTWHTVAVGDVSLLKRQLDILNTLPKEYVFLNYLRCHDDIGWGLDYDWLSANKQMEEVPHKKYLNDYFTGRYPGSPSRGELYNDDPTLGDARLCGTTASLCGVEKAAAENDGGALERTVRKVCMLHAFIFTLSGIPVLYSGDEVGRFNDWDYHKDEKKRDDSRYLHRGDFQWDLAGKRKDPDSYQGRIYKTLLKMEKFRKSRKVFSSDAAVWTAPTEDDAILCILRAAEGQKLIGLFNFSGEERTARIHEEGQYQDFETGEVTGGYEVLLEPYGYRWLTQRQ